MRTSISTRSYASLVSILCLVLLLAGSAAAQTAVGFTTPPPNTIGATIQGCDNPGGSFSLPTTNNDYGTSLFVCPTNAYTTGNLQKNWAELDLVPFRLTTTNSDKSNSATYNIIIAGEYTDVGHLGWDVIGSDVGGNGAGSTSFYAPGPDVNPNSDSSCSAEWNGFFTNGAGLSGSDASVYRVLQVTQGPKSTCIFDYYMRLALGAHLYPGSSLHGFIAQTADFKGGEKDVPLPVKQVAPQQMSKTMTASQNSDHTWTISKSITGVSGLPNTCSTTGQPLDGSVSIQINWSKAAAVVGGPIAVTATITLTNPASRTVNATVEDKVYQGTGTGGTLVHDYTFPIQTVPAASNGVAGTVILTDTFSDTSSAAEGGSVTNYFDQATATYTDLITGVPVPGNTTATASAAVQYPSTLDKTALITEVETLKDPFNLLQFEVTNVADTWNSNGTFTSPCGLDVLTNSCTWTSGTLGSDQDNTDSGTITFSKTIQASQAGTTTTGTLADTATLNGSDGFTASAKASTGISAAVSVSLTINKNITPSGSGSFTFHIYNSLGRGVGGNTLGTELPACTGGSLPTDPCSPKTISISSGSSNFVTINTLPPDDYLVTEDAQTGWVQNTTNPQEANLSTNPSTGITPCTGQVTFSNTAQGTIIVKKVTNPAGGTGFAFSGDASGTINDGQNITVTNLNPGTYTSTEADPTSMGYVLSSIVCSTDGTGSVATRKATFNLAAGETITCTFTNNKPDANVTITPLNPVNEVGNAETFTITTTAIPNGASPVSFTSITPTVTPTTGLTTNTNTCATPTINGNVATCTITINSTTVGSYTVHVASVVNVGGVVLNRATSDALPGDSSDAVKHYVDANITIGPATATNEVGSPHTFTITVTALPDDTGTPTFGTVTATVTPTPSTLGAVTCNAPVGNVETCSLTINSTTAGTFTANASTTVTMGGVTVSRATGDSHVGDGGPAIKKYISSSTTLVFNGSASTPNTATGGIVEAGSTVTVVVTETNTGSDQITNVSVTGGGACTSFTGGASTLAAGASTNFTCTFTAGAGANAWNATGNGTDSLGNAVPLTGETTSGSVFGDQSSTSLTFNTTSSNPNTATGGIVENGATVTVVVTEKNTGNNALTGVSVTGGGACTSFTGGATTLAVGASADFTCTFTAGPGANAWNATGNGTDSAGKAVPTTGETASGSVFGDQSSTTLTFNTSSSNPNTATGGIVENGATVTVVVTEKNTGNNALTGVSVTGGGACTSFTGGASTLAVGASADFTCTFTAGPGANAWNATGNGTDSAGKAVPTTGETASGSVFGDTSSTTLAFNTSLSNPNTATGGIVESGATVTVVVTETNTGNNALTGVSVTGGGACTNFTGGSSTLAVGASTNFTCTFTAAAGANAWNATGNGTDSAGKAVPTTGETASGSVTGDQSSTTLTFNSTSSTPNTATGGSVQTGATVTVVVTEKNTGNNTITGVNVTGGGSCTSFTGGLTTLAAGASTDFTCTFTAVSGSNAWSATGHGTDSAGNAVPLTGETTSGSVKGVLSTLILVKNTVGGNGTFQFAGTGAGVPASIPLTTSGGTASVTYANIVSGAKSLAETVPAGWAGNTTNVSCVETVAGITASTFGTLTTGVVAPGGTVTANITNLGIGATVKCTFTNSLQPTIIIKKITDPPNTGNFTFTTTGAGYNGFSLGGGQQNSQSVMPGTYTVTEGMQLGWVLTGIGMDPSNPNNPLACAVTGTGGSSGLGNLNTGSASITVYYGDTVTCVFENTGSGVTRTQGFWATHSQLANLAWFGGAGYGHTFPGVAGVAGIGDTTLCTRSLDLSDLMGGFWSGISKTSTGKQRSSLDQARMQLLQQLLAAELNASAFGSVPSGGSGQFATWESAYCGTSQSAISSAQQQAASFNSKGDNSTFTPGTAADSKTARAIANYKFWDVLP